MCSRVTSLGPLCQVSKYSKVKHALEFLTSSTENVAAFDMIMVDEMMPEMTGSEMIYRLREYELLKNRPHVPVICVTANASEHDRIKCAPYPPLPAAVRNSSILFH